MALLTYKVGNWSKERWPTIIPRGSCMFSIAAPHVKQPFAGRFSPQVGQSFPWFDHYPCWWCTTVTAIRRLLPILPSLPPEKQYPLLLILHHTWPTTMFSRVIIITTVTITIIIIIIIIIIILFHLFLPIWWLKSWPSCKTYRNNSLFQLWACFKIIPLKSFTLLTRFKTCLKSPQNHSNIRNQTILKSLKIPSSPPTHWNQKKSPKLP